MKYLSYKSLGSRNFPEILLHAMSLLFFVCLSLIVKINKLRVGGV